MYSVLVLALGSVAAMEDGLGVFEAEDNTQ